MTSTERHPRTAAPSPAVASPAVPTTAAPTGPSLRVDPAPARTDLGDVRVPETRYVAAPTVAPPPVAALAVRVTGAAVAVFSAAWAGAFMLVPEGASSLLGTATAVAFQGSLLALLALMWRTTATGARTAGRVLLGIVAGVLAVATVQSVSEAVPGAVADTLTAVLDPFWPASMLGMLVVGVTVACVGRWRGAARVWAPVATSWIAILPAMALVPEAAMGFLATGHILVGYVVLGVILAVRPDLTGRRDHR